MGGRRQLPWLADIVKQSLKQSPPNVPKARSQADGAMLNQEKKREGKLFGWVGDTPESCDSCSGRESKPTYRVQMNPLMYNTSLLPTTSASRSWPDVTHSGRQEHDRTCGSNSLGVRVGAMWETASRPSKGGEVQVQEGLRPRRRD